MCIDNHNTIIFDMKEFTPELGDAKPIVPLSKEAVDLMWRFANPNMKHITYDPPTTQIPMAEFRRTLTKK